MFFEWTPTEVARPRFSENPVLRRFLLKLINKRVRQIDEQALV